MDIQEIRLWHTRRLIKLLGGPGALADRMGCRTSHITGIAGPNPTRTIGDKTAEKIEHACGLSPGALDLPIPEETVQADPLLSEIAAILTGATTSSKELVLQFAHWIRQRELPSYRHGATRGRLVDLHEAIDDPASPAELPMPNGSIDAPAKKPQHRKRHTKHT